MANKQYSFASSVATDYITIANTSGTIYASGTTPVSWSSGAVTGTIKYYIHTNSACGTQNVSRTRYIAVAGRVLADCQRR
ncbi:hypothetical protein [Flavobacterium sp. 3HN19-14]|uniref:hypothetical protein n=1 Tax=Flavobacterium sp. 3HN19-14 TaxID=3448133 RepID=UPI003EE0B7C0